MPALNIIATQETVLNSGFSSSVPRGMLPYRLAASHRTNTTKNEASRTNAQPVLVMTQSRAPVEAVFRLAGPKKPQQTKAMAMAPVTPKITLSTPCRGCSPWVGTGGRDRDCSISWAWCGDAASSPVASTPRADVGQLAGGHAGIAVGLGLGGQGTPFRFGSAQSTTTSLTSSCRWSVRGRWSGPLDPTGTAGRAPRRSRPLWWRWGARIKLGTRVPVLRTRHTSRRGG